MSDKALLMSIAEKLTYLKLKSQSRSDPGGNFETMYYLTGARDNMGGQVGMITITPTISNKAANN